MLPIDTKNIPAEEGACPKAQDKEHGVLVGEKVVRVTQVTGRAGWQHCGASVHTEVRVGGAPGIVRWPHGSGLSGAG